MNNHMNSHSIFKVNFDKDGFTTLRDNDTCDTIVLLCTNKDTAWEVFRLIHHKDNWLESKADILNDLDPSTTHPKENLLKGLVASFVFSEEPCVMELTDTEK